jgi:hypothetical protein
MLHLIVVIAIQYGILLSSFFILLNETIADETSPVQIINVRSLLIGVWYEAVVNNHSPGNIACSPKYNIYQSLV